MSLRIAIKKTIEAEATVNSQAQSSGISKDKEKESLKNDKQKKTVKKKPVAEVKKNVPRGKVTDKLKGKGRGKNKNQIGGEKDGDDNTGEDEDNEDSEALEMQDQDDKEEIGADLVSLFKAATENSNHGEQVESEVTHKPNERNSKSDRNKNAKDHVIKTVKKKATINDKDNKDNDDNSENNDGDGVGLIDVKINNEKLKVSNQAIEEKVTSKDSDAKFTASKSNGKSHSSMVDSSPAITTPAQSKRQIPTSLNKHQDANERLVQASSSSLSLSLSSTKTISSATRIAKRTDIDPVSSVPINLDPNPELHHEWIDIMNERIQSVEILSISRSGLYSSSVSSSTGSGDDTLCRWSSFFKPYDDEILGRDPNGDDTSSATLAFSSSNSSSLKVRGQTQGKRSESAGSMLPPKSRDKSSPRSSSAVTANVVSSLFLNKANKIDPFAVYDESTMEMLCQPVDIFESLRKQEENMTLSESDFSWWGIRPEMHLLDEVRRKEKKRKDFEEQQRLNDQKWKALDEEKLKKENEKKMIEEQLKKKEEEEMRLQREERKEREKKERERLQQLELSKSGDQKRRLAELDFLIKNQSQQPQVSTDSHNNKSVGSSNSSSSTKRHRSISRSRSKSRRKDEEEYHSLKHKHKDSLTSSGEKEKRPKKHHRSRSRSRSEGRKEHRKRSHKDSEKKKDKDRDRDRERDKGREKDKNKERDKKDRDNDRDKKDRGKEKEKEKDYWEGRDRDSRERDWDKDRGRGRDSRDRKDRDRDRDKNKDRDRHRDSERDWYGYGYDDDKRKSQSSHTSSSSYWHSSSSSSSSSSNSGADYGGKLGLQRGRERGSAGGDRRLW